MSDSIASVDDGLELSVIQEYSCISENALDIMSRTFEPIASHPPHHPLHEIVDGHLISYGYIFNRMLKLPAELQMLILRHILVMQRPLRGIRLRHLTRRRLIPWLLLHKSIAPQVSDLWWKENTFLIHCHTILDRPYVYRPPEFENRVLRMGHPPKYALPLIQIVRVVVRHLRDDNKTVFLKLLKVFKQKGWTGLKEITFRWENSDEEWPLQIAEAMSSLEMSDTGLERAVTKRFLLLQEHEAEF